MTARSDTVFTRKLRHHERWRQEMRHQLRAVVTTDKIILTQSHVCENDEEKCDGTAHTHVPTQLQCENYKIERTVSELTHTHIRPVVCTHNNHYYRFCRPFLLRCRRRCCHRHCVMLAASNGAVAWWRIQRHNIIVGFIHAFYRR